MNRKLKEIEYRIKGEIIAKFCPSTVEHLHKYANVNKIFVFLCGFYQNMGDMAITYAHIEFLKKKFSDYEVIAVPSNRTYHWMKEIKKILTEDDLITVIGGGNMSDLYISLEYARRFIVRKFPKNRIVLFPQTIDFTDTRYGRYQMHITRRRYLKHKNLTVFAREERSLAVMKNVFGKRARLCPDMVLSLNKSEPKLERSGMLCCIRSDKESNLGTKSDEIRDTVTENYDDVIFKDTVDVTLEECKPENYGDTLESFWSLLKTKKAVVTDRLHCMIFCAITATPCLFFDNSNHKISGVKNAWLNDVNYIRLCDSTDNLKNEIDELINLDTSTLQPPNLEKKFLPLAEAMRAQ